jgi:hypothetical protein
MNSQKEKGESFSLQVIIIQQLIGYKLLQV